MKRVKELMYYFSIKLPSTILGKLKGNLIYTHWGRGLNNFGDCLAPDILKHYGFTPVYSQTSKADIILAGTILQWTPSDFKGIILGSGSDNVPLYFPNAKILGVRGKCTLNNLNVKEKNSIVLGDPGLIMNKVFPEVINKKYNLGIVPHFVDNKWEVINKWEKEFGNSCVVIDVLKRPKDVINLIKSCKHIVSSSLHGLIIADAFNIPNVRIINRTTMPTIFYDYKFEDYYSSLNTTPKALLPDGSETMKYLISNMHTYVDEVEKLQKELDQLLKNLKNYLNQCSSFR